MIRFVNHLWFSSPDLTSSRPLGLRGIVFLGLLQVCAVTVLGSGVATQTDWSHGPAEQEVAPVWDRSFKVSEGVSWLALPGQITLSGVVLDPPVKSVIAHNFVRPSSLDAADIDGDGDLDLVGAAIGGNQVRWWRNEGGQPPTWTSVIIEFGFAGASSVRAADVDGDGSVDVVGCAWADNEVAVWFNGGQGVSWTRQSVATEFTQCHWVDVADLDGDGDIDLLGAAADADTVAVWTNDGALPIAWTMHVIDAAYGGARSLVPADLDDDGDLDLLGTALDDDDVSWWRNDGGEPITWTRIIVSDSLAGAHHADAWDMDLDGDLDIVAAGFGHPWLKLWRNDGEDPIGWIEEDIGDAIVAPLVVDACDLDGDGDMDVAATSNNWDRVMWWKNNGGPPASWSAFNITTGFTNAWPLDTADIDGNGTLDIVSGASGAFEVAWWRMTDFVSSGVLESRVLTIPDHVIALECLLDAVVPPETDVAVAIRVGVFPDDLGAWVPIEPGRSHPVMVRRPVYLQYRMELTTMDATVAPIVREVSFEWTSELRSPRKPGGRVHP